MRHSRDNNYAEPVAVSVFAQTCLVWIRFSSSRLERLPDSGEPFFYLPSPRPSDTPLSGSGDRGEIREKKWISKSSPTG